MEETCFELLKPREFWTAYLQDCIERGEDTEPAEKQLTQLDWDEKHNPNIRYFFHMRPDGTGYLERAA